MESILQSSITWYSNYSGQGSTDGSAYELRAASGTHILSILIWIPAKSLSH